jgi:hypothetical protein
MVHHHGTEYQIRLIRENEPDELSEWIEAQNIASIMAALQKRQALHNRQVRAYWLRERNVRAPGCSLCRDGDAEVTERPLVISASPRNHPRNSNYRVLIGEKNRYELP